MKIQAAKICTTMANYFQSHCGNSKHTGLSRRPNVSTLKCFGYTPPRARWRRNRVAQHGYVKVFFVAYYLLRELRILPPDDRTQTHALYINCHLCQRPHCHSGLLASGSAKRSLPQAEIWVEPLPEARLGKGDEDFPMPKRKRAKSLLTRGQRLSAARGQH